ncbi:MAG: hypothetical protein A3J80_02240 [Desulfobacula sp. RIFOXYB2_FULL_45_6]|nr:MAG: hypothetical protein A3J80_02240 [Desulfobacula sp. RIFOXYB2_FULL_45_6]
MLSFKGIQKYLIYACIAGWMFFLGVVVGRGTSPVTFDTKEFSRKLEKMANVPGPKKEVNKKVDLKFYEDLDHSSTQEMEMPKEVPPAGIPVKETVKEPPGETVKESVKEIGNEPVKEIKKETVKAPVRGIKNKAVKAVVKAPAKEPEKPAVKEPVKETGTADTGELPAEAKKQKSDESLTGTISSKGSYTIQIAAYKSFQEAVSKMADLEAIGFSSYRTKGEKDGITFYRVRVGPFDTYDAAKDFKIRLDKAKVNSMIMKKESDEDIKE